MTDAQKMLAEIKPAIREIIWISQCWNDHNFSEKDLLDKCKKVARVILGDDLKATDVERANEWLERIDAVCKGT
jgi:hypothetical protein